MASSKIFSFSPVSNSEKSFKISGQFPIVGESMDAEAMILILDYKEVDGEEKPVLMAFKHGISEEKY